MRYETNDRAIKRMERRCRILDTIAGTVLVIVIVAIIIIMAGVMQ